MFSTLLFTFAFCALLPLAKLVTVSTKYGDIEGVVVRYPKAHTSFKSVDKFLGVPFATPPIGELRLKAPKPPQEWKPKVRPAKEHGNSCFQPESFQSYFKRFTASAFNFTYSEDCLYLDIYSPSVSLNLPVMVYIHGGGYGAGTAVTYSGDYLALHGVVVVVIEYRLGPFGFLSTGDSAAPGNFGMLDQVEALKWVKENIEHFGGNPSKVTIFGVGAGGATSASLHLLSPLSKGLFQQVIAESGVDFSSFAIQPDSYGPRFAEDLAEELECTTSDHSAMVTCIRAKRDTEIQKASESISNYRFSDYLQWAPVVDNNFLLDTPRKLRMKGDFDNVTLMVSFNSQEGGSSVGSLASASFEMTGSVADGVSPSFFKEFVTKFAYYRNSREQNADLIADALQFLYTPWPDNSDNYALRSQLMGLVGDFTTYAPIHKVADIHSKVAPVYMYEFAHRSKNVTIFPEWMGVVHGENMPYDFGVPLWFPGFDVADKNVTSFIMAVYANFAKTGDPTPQPVSGVTWEKYNSSRRAYLRVNTNPQMAVAFAPRRMAFWNDYHLKLKQVHFEVEKVVSSGNMPGVAIAMFYHIAIVVVSMMS